MSKETGLMVKEAGGQLATAADMLSREQLNILKATICKEATDQELQFFAHVCKAKQLDPFSGEIFLVKRDGKPVIQTGIDGFRAQADRSGAYAGSDEPDYQLGEDQLPNAASVTVYKIVLGARVAFTATVRWSEFYPGDKLGFMWRAKPFHMLGKCAEAQALRKAFPRQLAGMHIHEEMESANLADAHKPEAQTADLTAKLKTKPTVVDAQVVDELPERRRRAIEAFKKLGKTDTEVRARLGVNANYDITLEHLTGSLAAWYDELTNDRAPAEGAPQ